MSESKQIRLVNLSKSYEEGNRVRHVLSNADATFAEGEFVAILGKSGTGKSTMLNIISGIDQADNGQIWFGDTQLTGLTERNRTLFRRENVGFVFQFFNLIPTLTTWENVVLPMELAGRFSAAEKESARELLETVGLADRHDTYPDRLSGGEQQRVAIARALAHNPNLVLADEPTGNLDEATGEKILALLDKLTRQAGKTLVMVTHSIDAARYADRILYLRDGKLVEEA